MIEWNQYFSPLWFSLSNVLQIITYLVIFPKKVYHLQEYQVIPLVATERKTQLWCAVIILTVLKAPWITSRTPVLNITHIAASHYTFYQGYLDFIPVTMCLIQVRWET